MNVSAKNVYININTEKNTIYTENIENYAQSKSIKPSFREEKALPGTYVSTVVTSNISNDNNSSSHVISTISGQNSSKQGYTYANNKNASDTNNNVRVSTNNESSNSNTYYNNKNNFNDDNNDNNHNHSEPKNVYENRNGNENEKKSEKYQDKEQQQQQQQQNTSPSKTTSPIPQNITSARTVSTMQPYLTPNKNQITQTEMNPPNNLPNNASNNLANAVSNYQPKNAPNNVPNNAPNNPGHPSNRSRSNSTRAHQQPLHRRESNSFIQVLLCI
jgi:hypothetical protein